MALGSGPLAGRHLGIKDCAGQFIHRAVASGPCKGPGENMQGVAEAALGDSGKEMKAEAAVVTQGRIPPGSCPVPRRTSENIALLQWKTLGRGPQTKDLSHWPDHLEA